MTVQAYDTEFHEDGTTIDLISIGIVAEDGRELYLISSEFNQERAWRHPWLRENVWSHLPTTGRRLRRPWPELDIDDPRVRTRAQIARAVKTTCSTWTRRTWTPSPPTTGTPTPWDPPRNTTSS